MRPDTDEVLRLERLSTHVTTRAGTIKALDGVDLQLKRGETIGLVGESGSGKSMTALSIMRLVPEPAAQIVGGHIWFEGEDLIEKTRSEMTRIRGREIAMIPQDPMTSLNPVFTIGNQMRETVRALYSEKAQQERAAITLLAEMGIADPVRQMGNYPHELSGGMRQRVVGAIALAGKPKVLIADEATTSLDPTVQLQYLRLLKQIQSSTGTAIIFITHDFGIVARVCDRVAVMYAGRIVETARVEDLYANPAHPYTRALISSVPNVSIEVDNLPTIEGQPPDLTDLPPGCPFAPRCRHAFEMCRDDPPSFDVSGDHSARCWLLRVN
jgi:oligopeptide/dipeptide ABC transporter ATP-binding protein